MNKNKRTSDERLPTRFPDTFVVLLQEHPAFSFFSFSLSPTLQPQGEHPVSVGRHDRNPWSLFKSLRPRCYTDQFTWSLRVGVVPKDTELVLVPLSGSSRTGTFDSPTDCFTFNLGDKNGCSSTIRPNIVLCIFVRFCMIESDEGRNGPMEVSHKGRNG